MPQPEKHNYIAPDFWALLSDEMDGLRESLELPDDFSFEPPEENVTTAHRETSSSESNSCGLGLPIASVSAKSTRSTFAPAIDRRRLFQIYESRVDTVVKVFHLPTILEQLQQETSLPPRLRALELAILLLATCTLHEHECIQDYGVGKSELVNELKVKLEGSLDAINWLTDNDIVTMQALVLYVVSLTYASIDIS